MINTKELIKKVSDKAGLPQRMCQSFIDSLEEVITEEMVNGQTVRISGLLDFIPRHRHARKGVNPQTKESITQPAMIVPKLKASHTLKQALKGVKVD